MLYYLFYAYFAAPIYYEHTLLLDTNIDDPLHCFRDLIGDMNS